MKEFAFGVVGCIAGVVLFGILGTSDYNEALLQQERYCKNVSDGVWPDYQENFEENCKK